MARVTRCSRPPWPTRPRPTRPLSTSRWPSGSGCGVGDSFTLRFVRPSEEGDLVHPGGPTPWSAGTTLRAAGGGGRCAERQLPGDLGPPGGGFALLTPAFAERHGGTLGGGVADGVAAPRDRRAGRSRGRWNGWPAGRRSTPSPPPAAQGGFAGGRRTERASACWSPPLWLLAGLGAAAFLLAAGQALSRRCPGGGRVSDPAGARHDQGAALGRGHDQARAGGDGRRPPSPWPWPSRSRRCSRSGWPGSPNRGPGGRRRRRSASGAAWSWSRARPRRLAGLAGGRGAGPGRRPARRRPSAGRRAGVLVPGHRGAGVGLALERGRAARPCPSGRQRGAVLGVATLTTALTFGAALDHLLHPAPVRLELGRRRRRSRPDRDLSAEVVPAVAAPRPWPASRRGRRPGRGRRRRSGVGIDPVEGSRADVAEGRPPAPPRGPGRLQDARPARRADRRQIGGHRSALDGDDPGAAPWRYQVVGRGVLPGRMPASGEGFAPHACRPAGPRRQRQPGLVPAALGRRGGPAGGRRSARPGPVTLTRLPRSRPTWPTSAGGDDAGGHRRLIACWRWPCSVHPLVSSVRHRRRDLAVLKALGFLRGQVLDRRLAGTTVWLALAMGIPGRRGRRALDLAGGRADRRGPPSPSCPPRSSPAGAGHGPGRQPGRGRAGLDGGPHPPGDRAAGRVMAAVWVRAAAELRRRWRATAAGAAGRPGRRGGAGRGGRGAATDYRHGPVPRLQPPVDHVAGLRGSTPTSSGCRGGRRRRGRLPGVMRGRRRADPDASGDQPVRAHLHGRWADPSTGRSWSGAPPDPARRSRSRWTRRWRTGATRAGRHAAHVGLHAAPGRSFGCGLQPGADAGRARSTSTVTGSSARPRPRPGADPAGRHLPGHRGCT